jgi:hypothetical protein
MDFRRFRPSGVTLCGNSRAENGGKSLKTAALSAERSETGHPQGWQQTRHAGERQLLRFTPPLWTGSSPTDTRPATTPAAISARIWAKNYFLPFLL